ncbi:MAG: tetratricopeptide (TPR) repeat protein [Flavobacteriaceae bacterium]|jgi:tetratricopeptide (TPR) repeat protein
MSRLHLVILFICANAFVFGQNNLSKYLDFAQKQFDKGDYIYALVYYEKAMELDSTTVEILWSYAETLRAYKDYRKAEFYYAKVFDREEAVIYPASLLNWGIMQKHNGKYDDAIKTFKRAKKKYYKNKKGYLYQKSKRELASTIWAKSALLDTTGGNFLRLPETVNTPNSEFGHGIYNGQLIFSSLRADSISAAEEVYAPHYTTSLYSSVKSDVSFEASEQIKSLFVDELNTGNGAFSLDGSRYYFSLCTEKNFQYTCKIMVAQYGNGQWFALDSLSPIINEPGTNTSMPTIAELKGQEVLIFASNREGGKGGMDLYTSKIRNGNQYSKVTALKAMNSMDNDITPWWDATQQRLYYSSSWNNGFGGYDVFYVPYEGKFEKPINAGLPINSAANDLYYFKDIDTGYVTSNRIGVLFSKNPTCCSDIFSLKPPVEIIPPSAEETLADLNKRLPVTLYFHNDVPNPRSRDTVTAINYISSYDEYTEMLNQYKKEYSKGLSGTKSNDAEEDIENFFIEYVDKGVSDLELFRTLLLKELDQGSKINITVKGFASPLAKTDYNVNLTKRRISSLINYMREYDNGIFVKYLDATAPNGGKVLFSHVPFGEYTANQLTSDNPNDVQNSVYSRAAAIERKIEIQSVSYLEDDKEFALVTESPVIDLGETAHGDLLEASFTVKNKSNEAIEIESIRIPCDCTIAEIENKNLAPGESTLVAMKVNTDNIIGFAVKSIYLKLKDSDKELRLYISTEIK